MSSAMDFKALGKNSQTVPKKAKADVPFNVAMRLESIEINEGKPGVYNGFDVRTNEPVSVRMMTVEEGVTTNKRVNESREECEARIKKQYIGTGEVHRPRPSEVANKAHKTHCEAGGLIMFTKCMKNEDGTVRAHWVDTLERSPGAGCDLKMAHIRIEDIRDPKDSKIVTGTQVVIDVVHPEKAVVLNAENAMATLLSTFNNRNGEEKLKPFAFVRLINPQDGKIVLPPARANADYIEVAKTDYETGEEFSAREAADAAASITALMSPDNATQDGLVIRAAIHGIGDVPGYPLYEGVTNEAVLADLNQITDAVRSGALVIEVVPGERIAAGPATRASIIKSVKGNPRNPMNSLYTVRDDRGFATERRFAETFITTKLGKDGHRLFTKAVPADCFPKGLSMMKLATANDLKGLPGASVERAAGATAQEVETPDDMPFDPTALDKDVSADVDAALAQSADTLSATM